MRESRVWKYIDEHKPGWLAIERLEPAYPPGLSDCFWTDQRSHVPNPHGDVTRALLCAERGSASLLDPEGERRNMTRLVQEINAGRYNEGWKRSGWLELKYCEPNDKQWQRGCIPKLRPTQPMFLSRQARNGVPSAILLRVGAEAWYLWVAKQEQEWSTWVRGDEARSWPNDHWSFAVFTVADMILSVVREHLTYQL
jgi:hypothetical protein